MEKMTFSRPKLNEKRYLVFLDHDKKHYWLNEVKMSYIGKRWFSGTISKVLIDKSEHGIDVANNQSQYPSWCFLETEEDAKKLLLMAALDPRETHIFFRDSPDLWELGVKANWI
jgi:hypothetical protein